MGVLEVGRKVFPVRRKLKCLHQKGSTDRRVDGLSGKTGEPLDPTFGRRSW
jgi:hypothetical protein